MRTTGDTRARILTAATELFRRQGYTATGMKQILATADATYGSAYHFFPGGKTQLGDEVIRTSGAAYLALIGELFRDEGADPAERTAQAFTGAAQTLLDLDFADPCPVATIAMEVAGTNETLRSAAAEMFASWTEALAGYFGSQGVAEPRATATAVIALLEGAFMLGRASRSTAPVLDAAPAAAAVVRAAARADDGK
ncbi:TetR/AcrR family transcriptional regulator [Streptomyces peucetius]|uniref:TetR/AcrR family transcriptional regulator n=1 Tax=Streptomyces peucetius TaxID=1950 RepID=A0ABY6IG84_STRPE|nr:TetR/AcrR family transcriptional regulator [Streptomyces peucetius]UYQ66020.1 TetR/AcrR family transcriptional regulator [Streptomyces peucetius]